MADEQTEHHHTSVHHHNGLTTSRDLTHEHANGDRPHSHDVDDTKVIRELVNVVEKDNPANKPENKSPARRGGLWFGNE